MSRHRRVRSFPVWGLVGALGLLGQLPTPAAGQLAPRPGASFPTTAAPRPSERMQAALASNPIVAPYPIDLFERGGKVVLRGVVGTKVIYDAAIRTAIATGIPFSDELTIDTLAAHEVAARGAASPPGMGIPEPPLAFPSYGATGGYPPPTYMPFSPVPGGPPTSIFPPPLFGFIDEPFLGFEPPVISYPPYWGALSARRLADNAASVAPIEAGYDAPFTAPSPSPDPGLAGPPPGTVDAQISPDGVVTLRGTVPTMADRVALGQYLARTPGVSQVVNLLRVDPSAAPAAPQPTPPPEAPRAAPPPPPEPSGRFAPRAPQPPPPPADEPPEHAEAGEKGPLADLPELAGLPIRVTLRDGQATLDGETPSAEEAMAAYLAVKRHPGVVEVVDRLRFAVPLDPRANPLRSAADPRDVEEYLGDQIRRHLDGIASVDRVRLAGDRLDILGQLLDPNNRARAEAALRSTPILRGFALAPHFTPLP